MGSTSSLSAFLFRVGLTGRGSVLVALVEGWSKDLMLAVLLVVPLSSALYPLMMGALAMECRLLVELVLVDGTLGHEV